MTRPQLLETSDETQGGYLVDEQDFPAVVKPPKVVWWPVQAITTAANLYLQATQVVKADFGDLPYLDNEWQDVYATIPLDVFEPDDQIVDVCPSFLVGGVGRQETPLLRSDNWGIAIDQIDQLTQLVQLNKNRTLLVLQYRIRNLGQCQMPDVCLMIDALVYRPHLADPGQANSFAGRFGRIHDLQNWARIADGLRG